MPKSESNGQSKAVTEVGGLIEKGVGEYYAVLRDMLGLVRDTLGRADKMVLETIDTSESLTMGAIKSTRETLMGITSYATRTTQMWSSTARETLKPAPASA
jgi:hypothetical protein